MRTRTLLVGSITVVGLLGLLLTAVKAPAQEGPVKEPSPAVIKQLGKRLDPVERLQAQVDVLRKELAEQKAETARLQQQVKQGFSNPNGYSSALVTKTNWRNLPDNTLLRVWLRD